MRTEGDRRSRPDRASTLRLLGWNPADAIAVLVGSLAATAVLVNALFLQPGSHQPSTLTGAATPASSGDRSALSPRPRRIEPAGGTATQASAGAVKSAMAGPHAARPSSTTTAAAERSPSSKRVIAVQRALAEYGYGQIKPSGIVDVETQAAIQKFERERKLPVTGQASERVVRELAAMTGRPME